MVKQIELRIRFLKREYVTQNSKLKDKRINLGDGWSTGPENYRQAIFANRQK